MILFNNNGIEGSKKESILNHSTFGVDESSTNDSEMIQELALIESLLAQVKDLNNPLAKRLHLLCELSEVLDSFFEYKIDFIKQKSKIVHSQEKSTQADAHHGEINHFLPANMSLTMIRSRILELVEEQYLELNKVLLPALEQQNIRILPRKQWNELRNTWLHNYFIKSLLPVLTPIGLDSSHPFPRIQNKNLCFIISLQGKDGFGRQIEKAFIQLPPTLPELVRLPVIEYLDGANDYVFPSSIIHAFAGELFQGLEVTSIHQFRVTRNCTSSDVDLEKTDLERFDSSKGNSSIPRGFGNPVRLEVNKQCPSELLNFLSDTLNIAQYDIYQVNGIININRISKLAEIAEYKDSNSTVTGMITFK